MRHPHELNKVIMNDRNGVDWWSWFCVKWDNRDLFFDDRDRVAWSLDFEIEMCMIGQKYYGMFIAEAKNPRHVNRDFGEGLNQTRTISNVIETFLKGVLFANTRPRVAMGRLVLR